MNDQELIARAREVGPKLLARASALDRLAGALLTEMADRLEGRPAPPAQGRGIVTPHGIAELLPADWPSRQRDDASGTGRETEEDDG